MPAKGHDKSKRATGSTHKPIDGKHLYTGEKKHDNKLQDGPETPDVSPGGPPDGQVMEQKY